MKRDFTCNHCGSDRFYIGLEFTPSGEIYTMRCEKCNCKTELALKLKSSALCVNFAAQKKVLDYARKHPITDADLAKTFQPAR